MQFIHKTHDIITFWLLSSLEHAQSSALLCNIVKSFLFIVLYVQATPLISRLTDEKNAAVQQNNKLRQELVGSHIMNYTLENYYCPV